MKANLNPIPPDQCGITASGQFVGDICPGLNYWQCRGCRMLITAISPPDVCPGCQGKCQFADVTCYTSACGGSNNIDRRLL